MSRKPRKCLPGPTEEETWIPRRKSTIPSQLEKNHVVSPSSQDEALARHSVSREVPRFILKFETVFGKLRETPKVPWHTGLHPIFWNLLYYTEESLSLQRADWKHFPAMLYLGAKKWGEDRLSGTLDPYAAVQIHHSCFYLLYRWVHSENFFNREMFSKQEEH